MVEVWKVAARADLLAPDIYVPSSEHRSVMQEFHHTTR
jgi:hypothetical protein